MLHVFISSLADGSIRDSDNRAILNDNGRIFLERNHVNPEVAELVYLSYSSDTFTRYGVAKHDGAGIVTLATDVYDALATTALNKALVLPIADCIAAVLHDPISNTLMVSHLGRHNLEQNGGTKSVEYITKQFNCEPSRITAWLSPAADKDEYPLYTFDNRSLHDVATEQLLTAGLRIENITHSPIDTTKDTDYFSHSEFKKGNRGTDDGRFCVVAMLQD